MGTRATIRIKDGDEEYFIYRGHDGFPETVEADIQKVIDEVKGRWSGAEAGLFVSFFFGMNYEENKRLQSYELTRCFHGDESYRYYVNWNDKEKTWSITTE